MLAPSRMPCLGEPFVAGHRLTVSAVPAGGVRVSAMIRKVRASILEYTITAGVVRSPRSSLGHCCWPICWRVRARTSRAWLFDEGDLRHNDLFPDQACDGELLPVAEGSIANGRTLRCFFCDTEISYLPDAEWCWVMYRGMKSNPEE